MSMARKVTSLRDRRFTNFPLRLACLSLKSYPGTLRASEPGYGAFKASGDFSLRSRWPRSSLLFLSTTLHIVGAVFIGAARHGTTKPAEDLPPEFLGWIFVVLGSVLFLVGSPCQFAF